MRQSPGIAVAQFNHYVELRDYVEPRSRAESQTGGGIEQQSSDYVNDPKFDQQWALDDSNTPDPEPQDATPDGTTDADIDAPGAWTLDTGGTTAAGDRVVVAVVDDGFELGHPDLPFWKNTDETPGNNADDDSNGYEDDYHGWDAYDKDGSLPGRFHGTHVAGIAAAKTNNSTGIAGVVGDARIMPIAGADSTEAVVVEAYTYALDQRIAYEQSGGAEGAFVVVVNSSFGVPSGGEPANFPLWCEMYDTLGQEGILSVAAAPDNPVDVDQAGDVPTTCPSDYLISVTATTKTNDLASGAGYGDTHIDLGAPGPDTLSTSPPSAYVTERGTSASAPHVAGTVALLVSHLSDSQLQDYKSNPASVALDLKSYILNGTDPVSAGQDRHRRPLKRSRRAAGSP